MKAGPFGLKGSRNCPENLGPSGAMLSEGPKAFGLAKEVKEWPLSHPPIRELCILILRPALAKCLDSLHSGRGIAD